MDSSWSYIYTPDGVKQIATQHLEYVRTTDTNLYLDFGNEELDAHMTPMAAGDFAVVLGRPGNGKTAVLAHFARRAALKHLDSPSKFGPPILISLEMPVEEIVMREIALHSKTDSRKIRTNDPNVDWAVVNSAVANLEPIYYVGSSIHKRGSLPPIMSVIKSAINSIVDTYEFIPSLICIDYLQRMRLDSKTRDRRTELAEIVSSLKDIALSLQTRVILGSQVGRDIEKESVVPLPTLASGKETGSIEEDADLVLGCFRPARHLPIGSVIPRTNPERIVTDTLYFIQLLKQRNGVVGMGTWMNFEADINRFSELELVYLNPTNGVNNP